MVQSVALRYVSTATQTDPLDLWVREARIPPLSVVLEEERINLVPLEFINSKVALEVGSHPGNTADCLAVFPEPYEILPFGLVQEEINGCETREIEEPMTPGTPPGSEGAEQLQELLLCLSRTKIHHVQGV